MKIIKILLDFVRFTVPELIEFGRNTVTKMTSNATFSAPFVPLTQITAAVNDLEVKYNAAQNGGKQQMADMRLAYKTLIVLLRKQSAYVDATAVGSEVVILSSGFHVTSQPASNSRSTFSVQNSDNSGVLVVRHKAVTGAKAYVWQHCADPMPTSDSGWEYAGISTQCRFQLDGLMPGSKHWFRVAWLTRDGLSLWSSPVVKMVI